MAETHAILTDDTAAARRELAASQYGQFANAEELIRAHVEKTSPEVRAAMARQIDEKASSTLDLSTIEVPEGGQLLDAVVRGSMVSFVYETQDGDYVHGALVYEPATHAAEDDVKAAEVRAGVRAEAEAVHIEAETTEATAAAEGTPADGSTPEWPEALPGTHAKLDALASQQGVTLPVDASVAEKQEILEEAKGTGESA